MDTRAIQRIQLTACPLESEDKDVCSASRVALLLPLTLLPLTLRPLTLLRRARRASPPCRRNRPQPQAPVRTAARESLASVQREAAHLQEGPRSHEI